METAWQDCQSRSLARSTQRRGASLPVPSLPTIGGCACSRVAAISPQLTFCSFFYRTLHTSLNRLITSRLPLALPPHAPDSTLYATGLLHFAHIFLTFESLWADLLRDHASPPPPPPANDLGTASPPFSPLLSYLLVNPYDSPSLFTSTLGAPTPPSPALTSFLSTLRPRGLIRSSRLKRDLEFLLHCHPTDLEVLLAKYPGDKVAHFCTHIRKSVNEKPWTLVAYAWTFYMAIFSGGRWIRGGLLSAGEGFWPTNDPTTSSMNNMPATSNSKNNLKERGLSFWHFPGPHDGEDIKASFKLHLSAAETLFTPSERIDIIEESKHIFRLCAELVDELDVLVGTDFAKLQPSQRPAEKRVEKKPEKEEIVGVAVVAIQEPIMTSGKTDPVTSFLRRPEITGTLVAVGCLACVVLMKFQ